MSLKRVFRRLRRSVRRIAGSITTQFIVITAGLVLILATGLISINALILKRDQIATAHQHATTVSTLVSSMSYPYLLKDRKSVV